MVRPGTSAQNSTLKGKGGVPLEERGEGQLKRAGKNDSKAETK